MGNVSKHLTSLSNLDSSTADIFKKDTANVAFHDISLSQLEGLNEGQKKMVIDIGEYLTTNKSGRKFFMVQGGGGFGKSYSILRAIQHIHTDSIIAAAPSHFAKNVLKDFLGSGYKVTTVAALLGMKVTYDKETGEDILVRNRQVNTPPIDRYGIIIIDEASMIDDETFDRLLKACEGKKLIALGDYAQLPPVGQDTDSKFFSDIASELTQPMRFTGHIFDITQHIRREIDKVRADDVASPNVINKETNRISLLDGKGSGFIFIQNSKTMLKLAISKFKAGKGSNYARIIAYRNKTIDSLNKTVRLSLYGKDAAQFEYGEIVINNGGYSHRLENGKSVPVVSNGEVFKVINVIEYLGPYDIPCVELIVDADLEYPLPVVSSKGKSVYEAILKRITKMAVEDKRRWKQVKEFKDSFASFSYAYAISTHKVQGSTISHAFVLEGDILDVKPTTLKEKLQSLYVSISRASYKVYIFNKNFKTDNSAVTKKLLLMDGGD